MLLCSIKSPELTLVSRGRTACVFQDEGVERAEEDKVCGVGLPDLGTSPSASALCRLYHTLGSTPRQSSIGPVIADVFSTT